MADFRKAVLAHLSRGVEAGLARQNAATGRFQEKDGGFAWTNQDVQLALAALYVTKDDANPWFGNPRLLDAVSRAGDAIRDGQNAEGMIEFIKVDGSRWGWSLMPWPLYHWLETYALVRDHLTPERRARWEEGLTLAYGNVARQISDGQLRLHNIEAWLAMGTSRLGHLLGRPDWIDAGARYLRQLVAHQHPEGYWPEGQGPTTSYNRVYVHALGLQYAFFRDDALLPALERALDFQLHFTYPDGRNVETIDGRVRYHDTVSAQGWPGFIHFPKGRALVRLMMDALARHKPEGGLEPHVTSTLLTWRDADEAAIPQTSPRFAGNFHGRALVRRHGPWFICLSGYTMTDEAFAASFRQRWHLDRQNYLSIWHERAGLIIGGGNSKYHPDFSTFSMVQGRARLTQADSAQLEQTADEDTGVFHYGPVRGIVAVRVLDDTRVQITLRAEGGPCEHLCGLMSVRVKGGTVMAGSQEEQVTLDPKAVWGAARPEDENSGALSVRSPKWTLHLPPGGWFRWPIYPFNPYAMDGVAPPSEAAASASVPLKPGQARSFILEAPTAG